MKAPTKKSNLISILLHPKQETTFQEANHSALATFPFQKYYSNISWKQAYNRTKKEGGRGGGGRACI